MRDSGVETVEKPLVRTAASHSRERLLESSVQRVFRIFIRSDLVGERAALPLLTTLRAVLMMLQDPAEE
jgi:hypothetical protein